MSAGPSKAVFAAALLVSATVAAVATAYAFRTTDSGAAPAAPSAVAAQVAGRTITLADVEARWRADAPSDFADVTQKMYDGRRRALLNLVGDALVAEAAGREQMEPEAWLAAQLATRVSPVTDEDIHAFYLQNEAELEGRPLDDLRERIRRLLERQARDRARTLFIDGLRRDARSLQLLLEPPRQAVEVAESDPAAGDADAAVTLVVFSDFQCPFCARVEPTIAQLQQQYKGALRVVWKDFPLTSIHPQAFKAAEAAHCAQEQGRYFEFHARLFANQQSLEEASLLRHAEAAGLETGPFEACLSSSRHAPWVQAGLEAGSRLGVVATPTVFVNGRMVSGALPYEAFAEVINEELLRD